MRMADISSRSIEIGGHPHWMMEAGAGRALVLLHGGLDSSEAFFDAIGVQLATSLRVIAFDRIGHGRTADTQEPFHYAAMATETAAFIEALGLGPVDLCGWSDGGIVALLLSLRRPDLVRRQVLIGANYHYNVMDPGLFDPAAPWLDRAGARYGAQSPEGHGHFPEIVRKTFALWLGEPALGAADLAKVRAPTLVLNGDRDALIPLGHTVSLFEAIPGAQLAVIPGAGHSVPAEKPSVVAELIEAFLESGAAGR